MTIIKQIQIISNDTSHVLTKELISPKRFDR